ILRLSEENVGIEPDPGSRSKFHREGDEVGVVSFGQELPQRIADGGFEGRKAASVRVRVGAIMPENRIGLHLVLPLFESIESGLANWFFDGLVRGELQHRGGVGGTSPSVGGGYDTALDRFGEEGGFIAE